MNNDGNKIELRDYFAGLAMQSLIATDPAMLLDDDKIARYAYVAADAMIEYKVKNQEIEKNGHY